MELLSSAVASGRMLKSCFQVLDANLSRNNVDKIQKIRELSKTSKAEVTNSIEKLKDFLPK